MYMMENKPEKQKLIEKLIRMKQKKTNKGNSCNIEI